MVQNYKEYIDILKSLEPVFKEAGELALKMRATATSRNKFNTGVAGIDIVTEADTAVQEFILSEMAKTKLVECQLVAEEDTPSVSKFMGTNELVLTLDPIDGTIFYVSAGKFFSTIVCLHNREKMLYTFCNFPELKWTRKITENGVDDSGLFPELNVKNGIDLSKTIVHHASKDVKKIDPQTYDKLISEGYIFRNIVDVTEDAGASVLFFLNLVAGYYNNNPNPYDGLCILHYGQVKKVEIYSDLDISNFEVGNHGLHYSGWYLVLNK
jgi:hypothetical protein